MAHGWRRGCRTFAGTESAEGGLVGDPRQGDVARLGGGAPATGPVRISEGRRGAARSQRQMPPTENSSGRPVGERRPDEGGKQGVRLTGAGAKLRMKLPRYEPRMVGQLDDLH